MEVTMNPVRKDQRVWSGVKMVIGNKLDGIRILNAKLIYVDQSPHYRVRETE